MISNTEHFLSVLVISDSLRYGSDPNVSVLRPGNCLTQYVLLFWITTVQQQNYRELDPKKTGAGSEGRETGEAKQR